MADTVTPRLVTVTTGVTSGGANQRDYSYVGNFPGTLDPPGVRFKPAPIVQAIRYQTGVTAPWARLPMKFRV